MSSRPSTAEGPAGEMRPMSRERPQSKERPRSKEQYRKLKFDVGIGDDDDGGDWEEEHQREEAEYQQQQQLQQQQQQQHASPRSKFMNRKSFLEPIFSPRSSSSIRSSSISSSPRMVSSPRFSPPRLRTSERHQRPAPLRTSWPTHAQLPPALPFVAPSSPPLSAKRSPKLNFSPRTLKLSFGNDNSPYGSGNGKTNNNYSSGYNYYSTSSDAMFSMSSSSPSSRESLSMVYSLSRLGSDRVAGVSPQIPHLEEQEALRRFSAVSQRKLDREKHRGKDKKKKRHSRKDKEGSQMDGMSSAASSRYSTTSSSFYHRSSNNNDNTSNFNNNNYDDGYSLNSPTSRETSFSRKAVVGAKVRGHVMFDALEYDDDDDRIDRLIRENAEVVAANMKCLRSPRQWQEQERKIAVRMDSVATAIEQLERQLSISPNDPDGYAMLDHLNNAYDELEAALAWIQKQQTDVLRVVCDKPAGF